jgi:N-acetylglucosaminyldiphosphoundecaprenol N-acetyl-beta-D-mannosaminyltransferase
MRHSIEPINHDIYKFDKINICGIGVSVIRKDDIHQFIKYQAETNGHEVILHTNIHAVNLSIHDSNLKEYFNRSKIVFADGAGVILGARILGYTIPERITYADWAWELAHFAEQNKLSIFLLGGKVGVAEKAAQNLTEKYPALIIAGTHHGYFNKQGASEENQTLINKINFIKPNILIVAFGMPLQERWLSENWDKIQANIALTGGAVLDYVSGDLRRAPRILTDHGFEWFGRLLIQPKHLLKRYLFGNPAFISRVLMQKYNLRKFD